MHGQQDGPEEMVAVGESQIVEEERLVLKRQNRKEL